MFVTVHLPRFKIIEHKWLIGSSKKLEKCVGMSLKFRKLNDFITSLRISLVTSTVSMHLFIQTSSSISMTYFYLQPPFLSLNVYIHCVFWVYTWCACISTFMCVYTYLHMYLDIYVLIHTYLNSYMHTCFFFVGETYITSVI